MEQNEIDRLLRCRKIVEFYLVWYPYVEESYDQILTYAEAELAKEGFKDIVDFVDYNDAECFKEFCACYPLRGQCNWCGKEELKDQICIQTFGANACVIRTGSIPTEEMSQKDAFYRFRDGRFTTLPDRLLGLCPADHGYHILISEILPVAFDCLWKFPQGNPANSNWSLADFTKSSSVKPIIMEAVHAE